MKCYRKTSISLRFYVTETLEKHGFKHDFPDIVKRANIPHDTQISGSCFCLSSIVMRRILAELEPEKYGTHGTKKGAEKFLNINFGSKPGAGNPDKAFGKLIGSSQHIEITEEEIQRIPDHCRRWPVIIPYCPAPNTGQFVKISPKKYITDLHAIAEDICPKIYILCVQRELLEMEINYIL